MKNSKQGFTLAEVLITLGIIGVVAAITMPMLIGHYNKQVWVNQLKKTVSTLENGVKLMMAEDGVDWLYETSAWSYVPLGGCSTYSSCTNFHENLKKYFNATYTSVVNNSQLSKSYLYLDKPGSFTSIPMEMHLANGADIGVYWISKTPYVGGGWQGPMPNLVDVIIDVNGLKKEPNKLGRDVFIYAISEKGQVLPYGSAAAVREYCYLRVPGDDSNKANCFSSLSNGSGSWLWSKDSTNAQANCGKNSLGIACAARIMAEGWKMNY